MNRMLVLATVATAVLAEAACERPPLAYADGPSRLAGAYSLDLLDESGRALPAFTHDGRTYVLGRAGQRYEVRIRNRSPERVEAVLSVDGRDASDGRAASWSKRGYLVPAYDEAVIPGFRLSLDSVATFRFSSVSGSYAAKVGNAREVGVIGVAIFSEQRPPEPEAVMEGDEYAPGAGTARPAPRASAAPPAAEPASPSATRGLSSESRGVGEGAGDAQAQAQAKTDTERPGLGTSFGEQREAPVSEVPFERARPGSPDALLVVRYDDRAGLLALGIDVDGTNSMRRELYLRETARPFAESTPPGRFSQPPPGWAPDDP